MASTCATGPTSECSRMQNLALGQRAVVLHTHLVSAAARFGSPWVPRKFMENEKRKTIGPLRGRSLKPVPRSSGSPRSASAPSG